MPGFVRTKSDEKRWKTAKDAAAKETERGSEGFWKLSNYIFHKSENSQESQKVAEFFKSELAKFGGMGQLSLGEENSSPKQPSLQKLRDFLANTRAAKQSIRGI